MKISFVKNLVSSGGDQSALRRQDVVFHQSASSRYSRKIIFSLFFLKNEGSRTICHDTSMDKPNTGFYQLKFNWSLVTANISLLI